MDITAILVLTRQELNQKPFQDHIDFDYAKDIDFIEVCRLITRIFDELGFKAVQ